MVEHETHALAPGTMLKGKYRIERIIGEGGFGITYCGIEMNSQLRVAIKEYFPFGYAMRDAKGSGAVAAKPDTDSQNIFPHHKKRFLKEAQKLTQCKHIVSVVGICEYFEENHTAYIVMEYLNGLTLKHYLQENGPLESEWFCRLMLSLLRDIHLVHQLGILHRDISLDNVMLVEGQKLKLVDFGAASDYDNVSDRRNTTMLLKHGFAPFEQYTRQGKQGPWTDIYALSAIMYNCITNVLPETSTDRMVQDKLRLPSELGIRISTRVEEVIAKGLSVQYELRYQTALDMADALEAAMDSPRTLSAGRSYSATIIEDPEEQNWYKKQKIGLQNEKHTIVESQDTTKDDISIKKSVSKTVLEEAAHTENAFQAAIPQKGMLHHLLLVGSCVALCLLLVLAFQKMPGKWPSQKDIATYSTAVTGIQTTYKSSSTPAILPTASIPLVLTAAVTPSPIAGSMVTSSPISMLESVAVPTATITLAPTPKSTTIPTATASSFPTPESTATAPPLPTPVPTAPPTAAPSPLPLVRLCDYTEDPAMFLISQAGETDCIIEEFIGNASHVRIPSKIDHKKVTAIQRKAFEEASSIVDIQFPETITSLDSQAIYQCHNLTTVWIPESVISMADDVFDNCTALQQIMGVPGSVAETYAVKHKIAFKDSRPLIEEEAMRILEQGQAYASAGKQLQAIECFEQAAEMHNAEAMAYAGFYYLTDPNAGTVDTERGKAWIERAIEHDNAMAMYVQGYICASGIGMEEADLKLAVEWFEKAAEKGNRDAMLYLSYYYRLGGKRLLPDSEKADYWYQRAQESVAEQTGQ